MNKTLGRLSAGLCAFGLLLAILFTATIFNDPLTAQVNRNNALPDSWIDNSGTNGFRLSVTAVPQVLINGTLYSGATTNVASTNTLFKYSFRNGLYVGEVPLTQ